MKLIPPRVHEDPVAEAKVMLVFPINFKKNKFFNIAGCKVSKGLIKKSDRVRLMRGGKEVFKGKIDTLKHLKDDVKEVKVGTECGISLEDFDDVKVGDIIQTLKTREEMITLADLEKLKAEDDAIENYIEEEN